MPILVSIYLQRAKDKSFCSKTYDLTHFQEITEKEKFILPKYTFNSLTCSSPGKAEALLFDMISDGESNGKEKNVGMKAIVRVAAKRNERLVPLLTGYRTTERTCRGDNETEENLPQGIDLIMSTQFLASAMFRFFPGPRDYLPAHFFEVALFHGSAHFVMTVFTEDAEKDLKRLNKILSLKSSATLDGEPLEKWLDRSSKVSVCLYAGIEDNNLGLGYFDIQGISSHEEICYVYSKRVSQNVELRYNEDDSFQ